MQREITLQMMSMKWQMKVMCLLTAALGLMKSNGTLCHIVIIFTIVRSFRISRIDLCRKISLLIFISWFQLDSCVKPIQEPCTRLRETRLAST